MEPFTPPLLVIGTHKYWETRKVDKLHDKRSWNMQEEQPGMEGQGVLLAARRVRGGRLQWPWPLRQRKVPVHARLQGQIL